MLIEAMKSAGPKMIVSTRGEAFAIASGDLLESPLIRDDGIYTSFGAFTIFGGISYSVGALFFG